MRRFFIVTLLILFFVITGCRHSSRKSQSELKPPPESPVQESHVSSPPETKSIQAKAPQDDRIIIPGGLKGERLSKLWEATKKACLDLHYTVASEDKKAGNLVCICPTNSGQNVITTNFDKRGFLISVKGDMSEMPIVDSMATKELTDRKKQIENALKKAAGIKK